MSKVRVLPTEIVRFCNFTELTNYKTVSLTVYNFQRSFGYEKCSFYGKINFLYLCY